MFSFNNGQKPQLVHVCLIIRVVRNLFPSKTGVGAKIFDFELFYCLPPEILHSVTVAILMHIG